MSPHLVTPGDRDQTQILIRLGLRWGLRLRNSSKLLEDASAAGLWLTPEAQEAEQGMCTGERWTKEAVLTCFKCRLWIKGGRSLFGLHVTLPRSSGSK